MQVDQGEQKPQGDGQNTDKKSDSEDMEVYAGAITQHQTFCRHPDYLCFVHTPAETFIVFVFLFLFCLFASLMLDVRGWETRQEDRPAALK